MKYKYVITIISIYLLFCSCRKEHGFIVDKESEKPLKNVLVIDSDNPSNYIFTNNKGEFEFAKCGNLIISKVGFITDTLIKYDCMRKPHCFDGRGFYMLKHLKKK